MFFTRIWFLRILLNQNFLDPKFNLDPTFFWTQNFFGPILFKKILGPHICLGLQIFLSPKSFWDPTFFGTWKFLETQNLFGTQNIFEIKNLFFWPKLFWTQPFFWTQSFRTPNLVWSKIKRNLNIECGTPSSACFCSLFGKKWLKYDYY